MLKWLQYLPKEQAELSELKYVVKNLDIDKY
jgi:hypothetical protein